MLSNVPGLQSAVTCALVLLLLLSGIRVEATQHPLYVTGSASHALSGELLYAELHYCSADLLECEVQYWDTTDDLLASKALNYRTSAFAPALKMSDLRLGQTYEFNPRGTDDPVVDAGFDNYVRSQWQALASGDTITFNFLPLGFDRPIAMNAQAVAEKWCDENWLCLRIGVKSWWLGLVAEPIYLAYEQDSQRLLQFRGVSNVKDSKGKSQAVVIRYSYEAPNDSVEIAPP